MVNRIVTLILLLISSTSWASGLFGNTSQQQFLPTNQAFIFSYQQQDNVLNLSWQISPGYYLYRKQMEISVSDASLAPVQFPAGESYHDEFFGNSEIYRNQLRLPITINSAQQGAVVSITYQGCAAGFCYPPQTRQVTLNPVMPAATEQDTTNNASTASGVFVADSDSTQTRASDQASSAIASATITPKTEQLPFNPLWALLIGIGIAFTPCVLPMYPLISSIVLGNKQRMSARRTLWLSFVYVQGMALTYTILGLLVAMAGLQFQAALQNPRVLITLSIVFTLLALSMFGLFTLQLPSSLQTRLALLSNQQKGGATWGVFSMGAIGGLICSPCTTAPLSTILLYIAQSGDLWRGGGTLYLYALGMGLPLILITVFGNRLLPKNGPWMTHVKTAFGFIILALPVFLLERVVGEKISLLLWALLGVMFFSWAFIISLQGNKRWIRLVQIICLAAAVVTARPIQDLLFSSPAVSQIQTLNFTQIHNTEQLNQAMTGAKGKPIMLDLYADWCVACKEFEKYTFNNELVQQSLDNTVLLQIDMTRNSPEVTALQKKLNVLGLPTILFFDGAGNELTKQRVTGFLNASQFLNHLQGMSR